MVWATLALLVAVRAGPAGAPDGDVTGLTLHWDAPAECPEEAHVRDRVGALLGPDAAAADGVVVDGAVSKHGAAYRLTLRVAARGEEGERTLEGATCDEVADAAAFIVAIAIDPDAVVMPPAPENGDPTSPEVLPEPAGSGAGTTPETPAAVPEPPPDPAHADLEPAADPEPEPAPEPASDGGLGEPEAAGTTRARDESPGRPRSRPGFSVAAQLGPGFGITAPVGFDVATSFALTWRRVWLELRAHYRAPRSVVAPSLDTIEGRFQMASASLRACGVVLSVDRTQRPAALTIPVCGGVEAGAIFGTGTGALRSGQGAAPWIGATAGPGLAWRPAQAGRRVRVGLRASAEVVVGFVRSTFETEQERTILETGVVGGQVLAGLELVINSVPR